MKELLILIRIFILILVLVFRWRGIVGSFSPVESTWSFILGKWHIVNVILRFVEYVFAGKLGIIDTKQNKKKKYSQKLRRFQQFLSIGLIRENILQEKVQMASAHPNQINPNCITQNNGKCE
jgi:hypothetical protein